MADEKYQSGPFTVEEQTITDADGRQWLEMTLTISSTVRVPLPDPFKRREVQLKAERMNLHTLAESINQAFEEDDDKNG